MTAPLTTFAIPCRNAGEHLRPLLESLLAQTDQDFAMLLVDDASDDGSPARARAIAGTRLQVLVNDEPLGLAANWNRAVEASRSDFVCLAHQDDVYHPEYLAVMLDALRTDREQALVHCRATTMDADGQPLRAPAEDFKARWWQRHAGEPPGEPATAYRELLRGNFVCCPSILYRRELFASVGGFRPDLRFTPDWDLLFRALLADWRFASVDRALVRYRRHAASATQREAASLNRYREELATLRAAAAAGRDRGLLRPAPPIGAAVRNNLLLDAYHDLCAGRADAARRKLAFGRREVPGFARDPLAFGVRVASRLGGLGSAALGLGLRAVLRMA
ncbi:MAG: glycosyltransferase [Planctomycetota bacterium]